MADIQVSATAIESPDPQWPMAFRIDGPENALTVEFRSALAGPLAGAYPAGAHDLEVRVDALTNPAGLYAASTAAFEARPDCRRITFASPAASLGAVGYAEEAGYRYVLDVEIREPAGAVQGDATRELSLLVLEPRWILDQPIAVDDLPIRTGYRGNGAVGPN